MDEITYQFICGLKAKVNGLQEKVENLHKKVADLKTRLDAKEPSPVSPYDLTQGKKGFPALIDLDRRQK